MFFGTRLPFDGFEGPSQRAAALESPGFWGSFTFDGRRGSIQLGRLDAPFPFRLEGPRLVIAPNRTDHAFVRVPPTDVRRLVGTWRSTRLDGTTSVLVLSGDLRFEDRGALRDLPQASYPYRRSSRPGKGAWSAREHTVTFRYDDGRLLRVPYGGFADRGGGSRPARLHI